jgi:hypothetical protein
MSLLAPRGEVSCKRCFIDEARSVRKLFNCGGLPRKPVYYHFIVSVTESNRCKRANKLAAGY